jgi:hypothetical protein
MLRYTTALNNKEASEKASILTTSICEDLRYLNEQCALDGNSILKIWKKKGAEGRIALLLQIDLQMYPHNWAEARFDIAYGRLTLKERLLIRKNPDICEGEETLLRLEFGLEDVESDLKILSAVCHLDHLEALDAERESILAEIAARGAAKEVKNLKKNASLPMQTQWGSATQGKIETLKSKVKAKIG